MAKAIVIREYGPPDVLKLENVEVAAPASGQLRLGQTAIGVNYTDVYSRSGAYQTLTLPGVPGIEGVGVVEAVGPDVEGFSVGDRVAYSDISYGAYASERVVSAAYAIKLPPDVDDRVAGTMLVKGLTAAVLVTKVHPLRPGQEVLVHAAAGGVGRLVTQWAKLLGATVIGTVGSPSKAPEALNHGCDHVILYREDDFVARTMEITGGRGVDVIYDGVGVETFEGSLAALAMRGHLVTFGQSSGKVPPFDLSRLAPKSASITRPGYIHYILERTEFENTCKLLFGMISSGRLKPEAGWAFPLADAAGAHEALEARLCGPLLLIP